MKILRQQLEGRAKTIIWLIAVVVTADVSIANVFASGMIKRTVHEVRELSQALEYEMAEAGVPAITPSGWVHCQSLTGGGAPFVSTNSGGYYVDWWGEPLICRHPGEHDSFDVYSKGENGMDDGGEEDDLASWAGVNEGYYFKEGWPTPRRWAAGSFAVGLVSMIVLIWRKKNVWLAVVPWVVGTLWGARDVDVFLRSSASETAPEEIRMAYAAAFLAAIIVLSIHVKRFAQSGIRKMRR